MEMTREALESRRSTLDAEINRLSQLRAQTASALQQFDVQLIRLQGQRDLVEEMMKTDGQSSQ